MSFVAGGCFIEGDKGSPAVPNWWEIGEKSRGLVTKRDGVFRRARRGAGVGSVVGDGGHVGIVARMCGRVKGGLGSVVIK